MPLKFLFIIARVYARPNGGRLRGKNTDNMVTPILFIIYESRTQRIYGDLRRAPLPGCDQFGGAELSAAVEVEATPVRC
jgi:hypothetical protein